MTTSNYFCGQARFPHGICNCTAVLHTQVHKQYTHLNRNLLYILISGTHSKFARKNNFLALGVCYTQTCFSAGRMVGTSRSRLHYYRKNCFGSTRTHSMRCLVNWIPLRIRVRSRNTQPHLEEITPGTKKTSEGKNMQFLHSSFVRLLSVMDLQKWRAAAAALMCEQVCAGEEENLLKREKAGKARANLEALLEDLAELTSESTDLRVDDAHPDPPDPLCAASNSPSRGVSMPPPPCEWPFVCLPGPCPSASLFSAGVPPSSSFIMAFASSRARGYAYTKEPAVCIYESTSLPCHVLVSSRESCRSTSSLCRLLCVVLCLVSTDPHWTRSLLCESRLRKACNRMQATSNKSRQM